MKDMYDELIAHRVYINKTMDDSYPLMACAVYAEDKMQTILDLWGIPVGAYEFGRGESTDSYWLFDSERGSKGWSLS